MQQNNNNAITSAIPLDIPTYCKNIIEEGIRRAESDYPDATLKDNEAKKIIKKLLPTLSALLSDYPLSIDEQRDQQLFECCVGVVRDAFAKHTKQPKILFVAEEKSVFAAFHYSVRQHYRQLLPKTFPKTLPKLPKQFDKEQFFAWVRDGNVKEVRKAIHLYPALMQETNLHEGTPLYLAAQTGQLEIVQLLIAHGAQYCELDAHATTSLHRVTKEAVSVEHLAPFVLLLKNGIDPNIGGTTPPLTAPDQPILQEAVFMLLEEGARLEVIDTPNKTAVQHLLFLCGVEKKNFEQKLQGKNELRPITTWEQLFQGFSVPGLTISSFKTFKALFDLCLKLPHLRQVIEKDMDLSVLVDLDKRVHRPSEYDKYAFIKVLQNGQVKEAEEMIAIAPTLAGGNDIAAFYPLHVPAAQGNIQLVELLLSYGANPNAEDKKERTALHVALEQWQKHPKETALICLALLAKGAKISRPMDWAVALVHVAASLKHVELIKLFLEAGADIDQRSLEGEGLSAVHQAVLNEDIATLEFLINEKADVNRTTTHSNNSPLHFAVSAAKPSLPIIRLLLDHGAQLDLQNYQGKTAYSIAKASGKEELIASIEEYRGQVLSKALQARQFDKVKLLLDQGVRLTAEQETEFAPLVWLAKEEQWDLLKHCLLHTDMDINRCNKFGQSVLSVAIVKEDFPLVKQLIEKKVVIDNKDHWLTPLYLAVFSENLEITTYLLDNGVDVNAKNPLGDIVALYAALAPLEARPRAKGDKATRLANKQALVTLLLERGAKVTKDVEAFSPLHDAVASKKKELITLWLNAGADIHHCSLKEGENKGCSAIHIATKLKDTDLLEFLIGKGATINQKSAQGETPLHIAAKLDDSALVTFLLGKGAGVEICDNQGESALYKAIKKHNRNVIALLIEHKATVTPFIDEQLQPLYRAIVNKEGKFAALYLQAGANANATDAKTGRTVLHAAVVERDNAITKSLLEKGAKADLLDNEGLSPLHLASKCGNDEAIKLLAKQEGVLNQKSTDGMTALVHACLNNQSDASGVLIELGADTTIKGPQGLPIFTALEKGNWWVVRKLIPSVPVEERKDVFNALIKSRHALLADSAINQWGTEELTSEPMFQALCAVKKGDLAHLETIKDQLDVSVRTNFLVHAVELGYTNIVKWLIQEGANLKTTNGKDENLLHVAARRGDVQILKILYNNHPNRKNNTYGWLMKYAVKHGQLEVVKLLLSYGIKDGGMRDADKAGRSDIVRVFFQQGYAVDALWTSSHSYLVPKFKTLKDIDASNLPLLGVPEDVVQQFKNPEQAITKWKTLFDYVQSPPENTTFWEWKGWVKSLSLGIESAQGEGNSEAKQAMRDEGLVIRRVKRIIEKAHTIAKVLSDVIEHENTLRLVSKTGIVPQDISAEILTYVHDQSMSSYFQEQLANYLRETPVVKRAFADLAAKAFTWWDGKKQQAQQPKAPVVSNGSLISTPHLPWDFEAQATLDGWSKKFGGTFARYQRGEAVPDGQPGSVSSVNRIDHFSERSEKSEMVRLKRLIGSVFFLDNQWTISEEEAFCTMSVRAQKDTWSNNLEQLLQLVFKEALTAKPWERDFYSKSFLAKAASHPYLQHMKKEGVPVSDVVRSLALLYRVNNLLTTKEECGEVLKKKCWNSPATNTGYVTAILYAAYALIADIKRDELVACSAEDKAGRKKYAFKKLDFKEIGKEFGLSPSFVQEIFILLNQANRVNQISLEVLVDLVEKTEPDLKTREVAVSMLQMGHMQQHSSLSSECFWKVDYLYMVLTGSVDVDACFVKEWVKEVLPLQHRHLNNNVPVLTMPSSIWHEHYMILTMQRSEWNVAFAKKWETLSPKSQHDYWQRSYIELENGLKQAACRIDMEKEGVDPVRVRSTLRTLKALMPDNNPQLEPSGSIYEKVHASIQKVLGKAASAESEEKPSFALARLNAMRAAYDNRAKG